MTQSKPAHTATDPAIKAAELIWKDGDTFDLPTEQGVPKIAALIREAYAPMLASRQALKDALRKYVAVSRCENPVREPLDNPEGYAEKVRCDGCGQCKFCIAVRALALAEEQP